MLDAIHAQVPEGRALPLAEKTAALNVARATPNRRHARRRSGHRRNRARPRDWALRRRPIRPTAEQRPAPSSTAIRGEALQTALDANKDLRRWNRKSPLKDLEQPRRTAPPVSRASISSRNTVFLRNSITTRLLPKVPAQQRASRRLLTIAASARSRCGRANSQTETEISHLRVKSNSAQSPQRRPPPAFRDVKKA